MMALKEKLFALIELMPEDEVEKLLEEINNKYVLRLKKTWDEIEEEEPDEFDLEMIREIDEGGEEYNTFVNHKDINWKQKKL